MQEETNSDIFLAQRMEFFPEHLRKKHQMIVMDPDQITVSCFTGNGLGKQEIGLSIGIPCTLIKDNFTGMVMQQWPQDGIYIDD